MPIAPRFCFFSQPKLLFSLLSRPIDGLFTPLSFKARPPHHHHHQPSPQTHTGPMLIILSAVISLLIVAGLFIPEIRSSLERLRVAAKADQTGRMMNAYQIV